MGVIDPPSGESEPARDARGRSFDAIADEYDRARPGYPERLVDDLLAFAGLPGRGRVLEIGCGTGQATLPFAARGLSVTCVEPGPRLAARARERLRGYPAVVVEESTFEEWPLPAAPFDLLISAQAFHWIRDDVALPKAADALRAGGTLGLFWNRPDEEQAPYRAALDAAYARHAPEFAAPHAPGLERWVADWAGRIERSGRFGPVEVGRYPWTRRYTAEEYVALVDTYSDHRALPAPRRRALYDALAEVVASLGGTIDKRHVAVLFRARRT